MTDGRRRTLTIAAALLVAALALTWHQRSNTHVPTAQPVGVANGADGKPQGGGVLPGIRQLSDIFDPSQPLFVDQTEPTTLNVAVSKADIPVAVPGYLPPKVDPKPEVWYSGETGEVGLRYGDALVVDYAPWNSDQTPQDEYPNLAQQWGAGEATTIGGHPAWVIAAGSAGSEDDSVSVVYLGLKGVEVNLSGKIPVDELVKVAASISSQGNPG